MLFRSEVLRLVEQHFQTKAAPSVGTYTPAQQPVGAPRVSVDVRPISQANLSMALKGKRHLAV